MENVFDEIIIVTSSLQEKQFDFCGITSKLLPSFYDLIKERNIKLVNHPILDQEIKKHIKGSLIISRLNNLEGVLQKYKDSLALIDINAESALAKLKELKLEKKLNQEYEMIYKDALMLTFTDPAEIFKEYFETLPPFSDKKDKKSEFPDAFIIDSVKKHIKKSHYKNILIISGDEDWSNAFKDMGRVSCCSSINEAMTLIQNADKILPMIEDNMEEILDSIQSDAECECFDIREFYEIEDLNIESVTALELNDIIPLRISNDEVLFQGKAKLAVDGNVRYMDENNSFYDREDYQYLFITYKDLSFRGAEAEVDCEITMEISPEADDATCYNIKTKIIRNWNIELDLDGAEVEEHECTDEELALDALREDKC